MIEPSIQFTQGDTAQLYITYVDGYGNPIDLTGATFQTLINESNGNGILSIPNSQHEANADQVNFRGECIITLTSLNTSACGLGMHKEILTQMTIGSTTVMFRGFNTLLVYPPVPYA